MTLSISSNFFPYRLNLKRKEPVEFRIEVANRGDKEKRVSLQILVSRALALDKSGLANNAIYKIDSLKPNEKKTFVHTVFPKQFTSAGAYPIQIKAMEHYQNYNYAEREYTKNIELMVDD
ncbi:MAG: hypothetical protein Q7K34_03205 [archaeon]|nr:hypothetical protein [archaeon]